MPFSMAKLSIFTAKTAQFLSNLCTAADSDAALQNPR